MSQFNTEDYMNGMQDAEELKGDFTSVDSSDDTVDTVADDVVAEESVQDTSDSAGAQATSVSDSESQHEAADSDAEETLTPLGLAKKEAAEYLEALQRERASFVNFRNRAAKEQERYREHGIIDVLTALLPALDDIDRVRAHGQLDESFAAVSAKIDKTFEKFGVEKFGEAGQDFDPAYHEAILRKPDADATSETIDTVVEAGYRIGDRIIRAARVVVAVPQE